MAKLGLYASMVSVIASVLIYIVLDDSQLAIYVGFGLQHLFFIAKLTNKQISNSVYVKNRLLLVFDCE